MSTYVVREQPGNYGYWIVVERPGGRIVSSYVSDLAAQVAADQLNQEQP